MRLGFPSGSMGAASKKHHAFGMGMGWTHLSPSQFFGIAFWIGLSINAGVIELWLHSKRRARLQQREAMF